MSSAPNPTHRAACIGYGLLGAPLAFGALPLYVALPHHYAQYPGVTLPWLGAVLLASRVLDAAIDPAVGRWADALLRHSEQRTWWMACVGSLALAGSFAVLWRVPAGVAPLWWLLGVLPLCTLSCSGLAIIHQAWGTRWGGTPAWRARIAAWREGAALLGVLLASALMSMQHEAWLLTALIGGLALGLAGLRWTWGLQTSDGHTQALQQPHRTPPLSPWRNPAFRRLAAVYLLNGMAAAVPSTLLPFFVADRLQLPSMQGVFLLGYFGAAALTMPLWVRLVARLGLSPTWRLGMACTVAAFAATSLLQAGDALPFLLICIASGGALGADLAVPGALLTGVVGRAGLRHEGLHAGWWALIGKLSLALAAGLSLPLLQAWGYESGGRDPAALQALALAYGGLPCALKLMAAATLWRGEQQHPEWKARS
jgi:Na+/melibiose symporter-like transporter